MKKCLLYLIVFFISKASFTQINWPTPTPSQQARIAGSMGEYRYSSKTARHRFHKGIDITNNGELSVHSVNSGRVYYENGDDKWNAWTTYIQVGDIYYYHVKPKESIINGTVTTVNAGDYIGEMMETDGIRPHVHLQQAGTNFLNRLLNPYNDAYTPLFVTTSIPNGVALYRNGLLKTTTTPANLILNQQVNINNVNYTVVYDKVDIVAHVVDQQTSSNGAGGGGQIAPFDISWRVRNENNEVLTSNNLRFGAVPNNDAAVSSFHPLSIHPGSPSIHIITSHPTVRPFDRYWNTRLRQNVVETWPNDISLDARYPDESLIPDSKYRLEINSFDVDYDANPNNNAAQRTVNILIDNFRPYVKKLEIRKNSETGDIAYIGERTWKDGFLTFSKQTPSNIISSENLWLKVYTSEPMRNVEIVAFGKTFNCSSVSNSNGKEWTVTISSSTISSGNQIIKITKNSLDLAGNKLEGYTSTNNVSESAVPKHQSDNTWSPVPNENDDISHSIEISSPVAGIPTNVKATNNLTDKVTVTWSAVSGATHYNVYRNTVNNSSMATSLSGWITTTSFNDATATPGTTFYYWVKSAKSSTGSYASEYSQVVTGKKVSSVAADFTFNQASHYPTYTVDFTNISSSNAVRWNWEFGDGYSDYVTKNPSHNFPCIGSYYVTLTVYDSYENLSTITKKVEVTEDYNSTIDIVPTRVSLMNYEYEFSVNVSDPDDSHYHEIKINYGDGSPEVSVNNYAGFDEKVYHTYQTPYTSTTIYPYTIVTTKNSYGETINVRNVNFTPILLNPPVINLDLVVFSHNATSPDKLYIEPGEKAYFTVSCSNCVGAVTYDWIINTIPDQLSAPCNCNTAPTTCNYSDKIKTDPIKFDNTGSYLITVWASDANVNLGYQEYILYVGDMQSPCVIARFCTNEIESTSEFALGSVIHMYDCPILDLSTNACFRDYSRGGVKALKWYYDDFPPKTYEVYQGYGSTVKCFNLDAEGDHKIKLEVYLGKFDLNGKFIYARNTDGSYVLSSVTKKFSVINPNTNVTIPNILSLRLQNNKKYGNIVLTPHLGSLVVDSGQLISLLAYNSIDIKPGVHIKSGSVFSAKITESPKFFNVQCYPDEMKTSSEADEDNEEELIQLYPNPANSSINFDFENDLLSVKRIEIYSTVGSLVFVKESGITLQNHIDLTNFSSGTYCVRFILVDNNVISKVFIKQ